MKIILIYGPPAVGKLTVSKELSKLTKINIFHNHYTVDLLGDFLKIGTDKFWKYNTLLRKEFFKIAIKEKINLIYTFCYVKKESDKHIKPILNILKKNGAKVYPVFLTCEYSKLLERVKGESRKAHNKLKPGKEFEKYIKSKSYTAMPFTKSLVIDNTNISAKKVAQLIKKAYRL